MTVAAAIAVAGGYSGGAAAPDLTPDAISFTTASDTGGVATSSTVTFTDIDEPISLLISEMLSAGSFVSRYSKNGGSWTTFAGSTVITIAPGDTLALRMENQTGSALAGRIRLNNASDGSALLADWDETVTAQIDQSPNNISITTQSTAAGYAISNVVTVSGINTSITLRLRETLNATHLTTEYRKNGGSWTSIGTSSNFSVSNGDTLQFRLSHSRPNDVPASTVLENASTGYNELDDWEVNVPNAFDAVPASISFTTGDLYQSGTFAQQRTSIETITGVDTTVTLRFEKTGAAEEHYVFKNGVNQGQFTGSAFDVAFNSGDTVMLQFLNRSTSAVTASWQITNMTAGGVFNTGSLSVPGKT